MRGAEIVSALGDVPSEIARAILDLDARAYQHNGGPRRLNELEVHYRLEQAIQKAGGPAKAASAWGVSRQHVYDVENGKRSPGPALQAALGIRRLGAGRTLYEILDL